ncbi:hypothetical protein AgCh_002049 [Apium graveolens]
MAAELRITALLMVVLLVLSSEQVTSALEDFWGSPTQIVPDGTPYGCCTDNIVKDCNVDQCGKNCESNCGNGKGGFCKKHTNCHCRC